MAQLPCIGLSWPLTNPPFGSCPIYFHYIGCNGLLLYYPNIIGSIIPYISEATGVQRTLLRWFKPWPWISPTQKGHGLKCPVDVQSYPTPYERELWIFWDLHCWFQSYESDGTTDPTNLLNNKPASSYNTSRLKSNGSNLKILILLGWDGPHPLIGPDLLTSVCLVGRVQQNMLDQTQSSESIYSISFYLLNDI